MNKMKIINSISENLRKSDRVIKGKFNRFYVRNEDDWLILDDNRRKFIKTFFDNKFEFITVQSKNGNHITSIHKSDMEIVKNFILQHENYIPKNYKWDSEHFMYYVFGNEHNYYLSKYSNFYEMIFKDFNCTFEVMFNESQEVYHDNISN